MILLNLRRTYQHARRFLANNNLIMKTLIKNGCIYLESGILESGSVNMVRNLIRYTCVSSLDAINMASANIARMMGCFDRKGSIAPGKDADIVFLNKEFFVKAVMCRGKLCHGSLQRK